MFEIIDRRSLFATGRVVLTSVPSKKILHRANGCFVAHHTTAQPYRRTDSEAFPARVSSDSNNFYYPDIYSLANPLTG